MSSPSPPLKISKEDYDHLPDFFKVVADVAMKSGKVKIIEKSGNETS